MLTTEYPVFSNSLGAGLGPYSSVDPFNPALPNFGALNPVGALAFLPAPSQNTSTPWLYLSSGTWTAATGSSGFGSGMILKYVRYLSATTPTTVAGPGLVYWTDETLTTVSGIFVDGIPATTGNVNSVAGIMLPNSSTVAGIGLGTTAFTGAILQNGGLGSFLWIAVSGFVPHAWLGFSSPSAAEGLISGATGTQFVMAAASSTTRQLGFIVGTPGGSSTNTYADIVVTLPLF
jgi:hypothetical protein